MKLTFQIPFFVIFSLTASAQTTLSNKTTAVRPIDSPFVKSLESKGPLEKLKPQSADQFKLDQNTLNQMLKSVRDGGANGGGGDDVGLEFQSAMQVAAASLDKQQDLKQVKVIVVDQSLDVRMKNLIQNSVAINFPEIKTILVNRARWTAIRDNKLKEGIALHELLSLNGQEHTGYYPQSSKYVTKQGGTSEELSQNLNVNRMQQLRAISPEATPEEVLKKYFNEANEPISLDDFEEYDRNKLAKHICQSVAEGSRDKFNIESSLRKITQIKIKEEIPLIKGDSGRGPLFPSTPDIPAVPSFFEARIVPPVQPWPYETKVTDFIGSSFDQYPSQIIQNIPNVHANNIGITVSLIIRKNNGLLTFRTDYLSNMIGSSHITHQVHYGYCYPSK